MTAGDVTHRDAAKRPRARYEGGESASDAIADRRRERWVQHRADRRAGFVDAGVRAVDTLGPDVSAEEIAACAGVSRTVLYRYFRDKEDLRVAVAERAVVLLTREIVPLLHSTTTPSQMVRGTVSACLSWLDAHPDLYRFLRRQRVTDSAAIDTVNSAVAENLGRLITALLAHSGLDAAEAELRAYSVVGLVESGCAWWLARRSMSIEEFTDLMCGQVWYVIGGAVTGHGMTLDPDAALPQLRLSATLGGGGQ